MNKPANRCGGRVIAPASLTRYPPLLSEVITFTLTPLQAMQGGKIRYVHRRKAKEMIVTVPPGIRDGQHLRLKGMGEEGKGGGESGDLYLRVRVNKPWLRRIQELLIG